MRRIALVAGSLICLLRAGTPAAAQPFVYVANLGGDEVAVIDARTGQVASRIAAGDDPDGVAVSPDGGSVYVAGFLSNDVTEIDAGTNSVRRTLAVGSGPVGLAVSPDGRRLYVANRGDDTLAVLDTDSGAAVATIAVGRGPNSVAVTPDGTRVYVTNSFSRDPGTVTVIDAQTSQVRTDIAVQRSPARVAVTPDGRTAYVTNFRSWNVSAIDTASDTVVATIRLSGRPSGVAVNPNGAYVYVTTLAGNVEIIDAANQRVGATLPVGSRPFGITLLRNGGSGYVANFGSDTVSEFDLAEQTAAGEISAGSMPFALAANCIGAACRAVAWTPKPTRTATLVPTRSPTPSPSPTSTGRPGTPTRTPTTYPTPLTLEIRGGSTTPGGEVSAAVRLTETSDLPILAAQLDLVLDPPLSIAPRDDGRPDCTVNAAIDKPSSGFAYRTRGCPSGSSCVRAGIFKFAADSKVIEAGAELYRCRVIVAPDVLPGAYPIHGEFGLGAIEGGSEYRSRIIDGTVQVVQLRDRRSLLSAAQNPGKQLQLCSGGRDDGLPCAGDEDCFGSFCVRAASVCDGGNDDGLLCQCSAGRCRDTAGAEACSGIESGACIAGDLDGTCCDPDLNCAGGRPCVATQRICDGELSKGAPCLRDEHCPEGRCRSVVDTCLSGDFEGFACIDDLDCPRGACSSSILRAPQTQPTPTQPPHTPTAPISTADSSSHGGGSGCQIGGRPQSGGAFLALLALLLMLPKRAPRLPPKFDPLSGRSEFVQKGRLVAPSGGQRAA